MGDSTVPKHHSCRAPERQVNTSVSGQKQPVSSSMEGRGSGPWGPDPRLGARTLGALGERRVPPSSSQKGVEGGESAEVSAPKRGSPKRGKVGTRVNEVEQARAAGDSVGSREAPARGALATAAAPGRAAIPTTSTRAGRGPGGPREKGLAPCAAAAPEGRELAAGAGRGRGQRRRGGRGGAKGPRGLRENCVSLAAGARGIRVGPARVGTLFPEQPEEAA